MSYCQTQQCQKMWPAYLIAIELLEQSTWPPARRLAVRLAGQLGAAGWLASLMAGPPAGLPAGQSTGPLARWPLARWPACQLAGQPAGQAGWPARQPTGWLAASWLANRKRAAPMRQYVDHEKNYQHASECFVMKQRRDFVLL